MSSLMVQVMLLQEEKMQNNLIKTEVLEGEVVDNVDSNTIPH